MPKTEPNRPHSDEHHTERVHTVPEIKKRARQPPSIKTRLLSTLWRPHYRQSESAHTNAEPAWPQRTQSIVWLSVRPIVGNSAGQTNKQNTHTHSRTLLKRVARPLYATCATTTAKQVAARRPVAPRSTTAYLHFHPSAVRRRRRRRQGRINRKSCSNMIATS